MKDCKKCARCGQIKKLEDFPRKAVTKSGYYSYCKKCCSDYIRNHHEMFRERWKKYRQKNKKSRSEYNKKYRQGEHRKERLKAMQDSHRFANYGVDAEEYNTMFDLQNGCCAICGKSQLEFKRSFGVDHNHKTGQVRGLLCGRCNLGTGSFYDDPELVFEAFLYLQSFNIEDKG